MVPDPKMISRVCPETPGDEIVISGIAGRFPNSHNMAEFEHNLYNKIDMVDDEPRRWRHTLVELPKRGGKIYDLDKFDSNLFNIPYKLAQVMDPQIRVLMEHTYEAITDAGVDPRSLKGTRTGVFIGCCFAEAEQTWFFNRSPPDGLVVLGCQRAFLANRLSHVFGFEGPSMLIDTACSSGLYALDAAFSAIRSGSCDAAIVGASNLNLHPFVTLQFARLGVLAGDGVCRPFCNDATGYTRSEAICAMFIQKAKDTKRFYCSVIYSKTNCDGYKAEGITYPSGHMQKVLLSEFYKDINLDATTLAYVEAHSTGTKVGDPEECMALDSVFCTGRDTPLPVGSVKSNVGHTEPAAALCSFAKVILAYHKGYIAPNINFNEVRKGVTCLEENRLQVVQEVQKLEGDLIGVNGFGFGGANAHCLLKGNSKVKINFGIPKDNMPRLVLWSGRTIEAVDTIFDDILKRPLDGEFIGLIHNIQRVSDRNMLHRGFGIFCQEGVKNATCLSRDIKPSSRFIRPVVWVFNGMGSQWLEMGTSLLNIPTFKKSILKCQNVVESMGLDILSIITSKDKNTFKNALNCFVGTAAIQIGLIDILNDVEMKPDYFIGHSIGELACAYADNCITVKEMILSAYFIGKTTDEMKGLNGSMAEISLGYRKVKNLLPSTIDVAAYNSQETCTISGPAKHIQKFVSKLKAEGIVAKEVQCFGIPFHSRYIGDFEKILLQRLKHVITEPKKISKKWLSSLGAVKTSNENEIFCSEYITKNIKSSVGFEQTTSRLPSNSLTIEIGPCGQLKSILGRNITHSINFELVKQSSKDGVENILHTLGRIYQHGVDLIIENLYPKIEFPVSSGTPMISSLIKYDHSEEWFHTKYDIIEKGSCERKKNFYLEDLDNEFIVGHTIDGRVLIPATEYLFLVWETFSSIKGPHMFETKVEFTDIRFLRATNITGSKPIPLVIMIQTGTGYFEITEETQVIVTGYIHGYENITLLELPDINETDIAMPQKDFYKELRLRGYHYSGLFKCVTEARSDGRGGKVKWDLNFVSFMDCLLQIFILGTDSRSLLLPTRIESLKIDPQTHLSKAAELGKDNENIIFEVKSNRNLKVLQSGGIEIKGMHANTVARRRPPGIPVLETYKFIPHFPAPLLSVTDAIRMMVQLALENIPVLKVKAIEVLSKDSETIIEQFQEAFGDLPLVTSELILQTDQEFTLSNITVENSKLVDYTGQYMIIGHDILSNLKFAEVAAKSLNDNGFLISREGNVWNNNKIEMPSGYQLVAVCPIENGCFILFQRIKTKVAATPTVIKISSEDTEYKWLETLKTVAKNSSIVLFAEKDSKSGIIGLVNCIRKEPDFGSVTCVFVDDINAPEFDINIPYYSQYLKLGLAINVWRDGQYGSYRHLQLTKILTSKSIETHSYANTKTKGDLSSLSWMDGPILKITDDIIRVKYSALNFRDCMLATGKLSSDTVAVSRVEQECILGFEYSGVNSKGKRVFGMVVSGAVATHVTDDSSRGLLFDCPDKWSLQEAATIAVVYITVYTALLTQARIKKGNSILIHAGSGGVGIAAITVSLAYGLNVFTTVSNPAKKKFLLDKFPQLKESQVGNSRNTSFEKLVMLETKGKGVDYVLNSLAQEMLFASLRCLGYGGQFLEIGKFDLSNDTKIGMALFEKNIKFHSILADNLYRAPAAEKQKLIDAIYEGMRSGIIQPLNSEVFPANQLEQAFRHVASGKHVGKVLIQMRNDENDKFSLPITVTPRFYCDSNLSYVIPGGLGGFGLELADWLIVRGATKIVINSRNGVTKAYQAYRIKIWQTYGIKVVINTSNIATKQGCTELIQEANKLGPVYAIFNLAVQLQDAIIENQTAVFYKECMAPKAIATKYLDEVSRTLCPQLKHFVIFSSVSCGRGNAGQSNYGMANSIMERICEQRAYDGLPAKAIQWGAIGEVGLVADMQETHKLDMEIGGTLQQRISSCLEEMDNLLLCDETIVSSIVVAEKRAGSADGDIVQTVMNIMSIRDIKSISMEATLSELGMDSLMSVEIKQILERDFDLILTPQDLRSLTFKKLKEHADSSKVASDNSEIKIDRPKLGVDLLFRNLGDETNSHLTILKMKNGFENKVYPTQALLIPGIEGLAGLAWENISASMSLPCSVLQLKKTAHMKTMKEIVDAILDEIVSNVFKNCKYFYLVGYSYGTLVALELARRLEKTGMKGHVMLIDGSPTYLQKLTLGHLSEVSDDKIAELLTFSMMRMVSLEENLEELFVKVLQTKSWDQKINMIIELSKEQKFGYSEEFLRWSTQSFYNKIKMILNWDLTIIDPIKADITLIRPTEKTSVEIDEKYNLESYSTGNVTLRYLEGDHSTILDNPDLPKLISEFDPSLNNLNLV